MLINIKGCLCFVFLHSCREFVRYVKSYCRPDDVFNNGKIYVVQKILYDFKKSVSYTRCRYTLIGNRNKSTLFKI